MMHWRAHTLHVLLPSIHDIAPCGVLYNTLQVELGALVDSETPVKASCSNLDRIVAEAYANLSATSLLCWRRLHTDASILGALVSQPLDAIAKLDTAIIVSGAAGEGRLDLILDIIQHIQKDLPSFCDTTAEVFERQVAATPSRERAIPCLVAPPSLTAFQSRAHKAPFILRAYARDWPALNDHPWASIEYLRSVAGPGRVVPVEVGQDYRTDDWSQKIIGWDEFLASLDSEDGPPLYLAQHSLFMQFPALRADIQVPDYVYADVPRQTAPPSNDEQLVINAWLGPRDTISPAHTDPYFNTYVQVVGRKTVWLAPPSCSTGMHATGNTAGVDVFADQPLFSKDVEREYMQSSLGPGDLLYIPSGWWHGMRAECRSFSVSMWF